jgi:hypothetical protein
MLLNSNNFCSLPLYFRYENFSSIIAGIYAIKVKQIPLPKDKEGCSTMLIVGDLSHRMVDQLATLVDDIFAPLLTKPENHKDLPEVAIQDICRHVHALRGTLYQVHFFPFFFIIILEVIDRLT